MFYSYFDGLCQKKGVSPNKACQEMGVSRSVAAKWKKTNTFPRYDTLLKISDYFDVPIDTLLKQKEEIKKRPDIISNVGSGEEEYEEADIEILERLMNLTHEELQKVDAFVQGLLANR